jgi:pimeloyl-ACP methyl ester carboxylesterase
MQTYSQTSQRGARHHLQWARAFGDRNKPPILLLHGIRMGRHIWNTHAELLADRYHVIAVDLPGHGALADLPFTEESVVSTVSNAIEQIAGRPALLVGYSLGGFVAMRHAARRPEETAGLVMSGCTLDFAGWKAWPYPAMGYISERLPDAWLAALVHLGLVVTLPRECREVIEGIPFDRHVFARTGAIAAAWHRALDEIASYRKPALIVNGQYDLVFRLDEKRFLHRLPLARLRLMRATDHTGPLRRAAEFAAIVGEFAQKVFAQSQPTLER